MVKSRKKFPAFFQARILIPILGGVTVILAMWLGRGIILGESGPPTSETPVELPLAEELQIALREELRTHGASWREGAILYRSRPAWRVQLPADLPIPSLHLELQERAAQMGMKILFAESEPTSGNVWLRFGVRDTVIVIMHLSHDPNLRREQGRIALLIDDFGDRWDNTAMAFMELDADITASVIPGRRMSERSAREVRRLGGEVVLHLPMEPLSAPFKKDDYSIATGMSHIEVAQAIDRALETVPSAMGMNNHMGSRVTSHRETITHVLNECRSRNLYFIDSRTTASTVAFDVAQAMGVRSGKRDVFLDAESSRASIRQRIHELANKAKRNGFAIGIGHCTKLTLEVLREEIPKIQAKGYRFVFLSSIL